jgi:hypothetical protein
MSKQTLYSKRANLVLGFHGCDHSVVEKVLNGSEILMTVQMIMIG